MRNAISSGRAFSLFHSAISCVQFPQNMPDKIGDLFFIEANSRSIRYILSLSCLFLDFYFYDFVKLANDYVHMKGCKFLYVTYDDLFLIPNKTEEEKNILQNAIWENTQLREDWFKSAPTHILNQYSELPQYDDTYFAEVFSEPTPILHTTRIVMSDFTSRFVNVVDNLRLTTGQPEKFNNTIHMFGGSDVYGFGFEDSHTIASFLQTELNASAKLDCYRVENHGLRRNSLPVSINELFRTKINYGDWVLFVGFPQIEP